MFFSIQTAKHARFLKAYSDFQMLPENAKERHFYVSVICRNHYINKMF